jgi:hypothetical protein
MGKDVFKWKMEWGKRGSCSAKAGIHAQKACGQREHGTFGQMCMSEKEENSGIIGQRMEPKAHQDNETCLFHY